MSIARCLLPALLAILAVSPVKALAQDGPVQRESARALFNYSYCVVRQYPDQSRRLLTMAPGSRAERSQLQFLMTERCQVGNGAVNPVDMSPQMLRGAIAEQLVGMDIERNGWDRARALQAPFARLTPADLETLEPAGRAALQGLDFAQCVQAAAPGDTAALLALQPATAPEGTAFQTLSPHFASCLPVGAELTLSRPMLRGFLAEATYRAAYAAQNGSR